MGRVYRVLDEQSGAELALKTMAVNAPEHLFWLKKEFRTLAELQHPNLVQFQELFSNSESTFFTMELIDGSHFASALRGSARPGEAPDYSQLLAATAQLAEGVAYLHARELLHRDLKPPNVLVARDGRVVLLDFGLSTSSVATLREPGLLEGTLAYMAPEVFLQATPAPANDWYSVGVMLYEALTGSLPFEVNQTHILAKQRNRYRPVNEVVPATPPALAELTHGLLRSDARQRAGFDDVMRALGHSHRRSRVVPASARGGASAPFIGRAAELQRLEQALQQALSRGLGMVTVEGRSGEGKTTLISHFLAEVEARGAALVLRGRCHPSEFVPFNALDGVIDDLSAYLSSLGEAAGAYSHAQHAALHCAFPVLSRIAASPPADTALPAGDFELRQAAFAALRELFRQLAALQPVVVWIDDLQWGQADSGQLLRELLVRPPVPVPLLFVLSFRSDERAVSPALRVLDAALDGADLRGLWTERIPVQPLTQDESRQLAEAVLLAHHDAAAEELTVHAEKIARGSRGNAFILTEFARHVSSTLDDEHAAFEASLRDMLERRFERLPDLARRMMRLVAIAGRPLSQELLLQASEADFRGPAMLQALLKSSLLRATDIETRPSYVVYHDQIRETLLETMQRAEQTGCHRRLAETLLAADRVNAEHVLEHLLHGEQPERAAPFAYEAALQAAKSLAFERAAQLLGLALELRFAGQPEWVVRVRHAEALANAGLGQRAGDAFLGAAAALGPAADAAGPARKQELRRRAAEQYLRAGCLEQGRAVLVELLGEIGVRLPKNRWSATVSALSRRLWMGLRGRRYRLRPARDISPEAMARVDLLWAGATSMAMISHWQSETITVQLSEEALRLGERSRIARVLGYDAAWEGLLGGLLAPRSLRTLRECQSLAADSEDPYDHAWALQAACVVHWFHGNWLDCCRSGNEALAKYRRLAQGTQWEQAVVQTFRLAALAELGRYPELVEQLSEQLREAGQRGDIFAATALDGYVCTAWLAYDQPERALEITEQVAKPWPRTEYLAAHYHSLITRASVLLYRGERAAALEAVLAEWPSVERAGYLLLAFIGSHLRFLKGRVALAALLDDAGGAREASLRRMVQTELERLRKTRTPFAAAAGACLDAGLLAHAGQTALAVQRLETAERSFVALDMLAHVESCCVLRGRLAGDAELSQLAASRLRARGVCEPLRFARYLVGVLG